MAKSDREHLKYRKSFESGEFYHIYNKAVRNDQLFFSDENYRFFLRKFHQYTVGIASVYSYCLLENHFHFLIRIEDDVDSSTVIEGMRRFFISYSKALKNYVDRKGTLFERHLKRVKIESEEQLLWTIYYIHRNPTHHFITENYERYRWSSYPTILSTKETNLKREEVLSLFSGEDNFVEFHDRNIEEDILQKRIAFKEQ